MWCKTSLCLSWRNNFAAVFKRMGPAFLLLSKTSCWLRELSPEYSTASAIFDFIYIYTHINTLFVAVCLPPDEIVITKEPCQSSWKLQRLMGVFSSAMDFTCPFLKGCVFSKPCFPALSADKLSVRVLMAQASTPQRQERQRRQRWRTNDCGFCRDLFVGSVSFLHPNTRYLSLCFSLFPDSGVSHGDAVSYFGSYWRSFIVTPGTAVLNVSGRKCPKEKHSPGAHFLSRVHRKHVMSLIYHTFLLHTFRIAKQHLSWEKGGPCLIGAAFCCAWRCVFPWCCAVISKKFRDFIASGGKVCFS